MLIDICSFPFFRSEQGKFSLNVTGSTSYCTFPFFFIHLLTNMCPIILHVV